MGAEWRRREDEKEEDRRSMRGKGKEGPVEKEAFGLRLRKNQEKGTALNVARKALKSSRKPLKHENRKLPLAFPPTGHVVTDVMMRTPREVD